VVTALHLGLTATRTKGLVSFAVLMAIARLKRQPGPGTMRNLECRRVPCIVSIVMCQLLQTFQSCVRNCRTTCEIELRFELGDCNFATDWVNVEMHVLVGNMTCCRDQRS
jgi:hypothetical protein